MGESEGSLIGYSHFVLIQMFFSSPARHYYKIGCISRQVPSGTVNGEPVEVHPISPL